MTIIDESTEDINSDPFSRPFIDNYCSENEAKVYLTREDIIELGFLRSNPERKIFKHKDKPKLTLIQYSTKDYGVKDLVVEVTKIFIENRPVSDNIFLYTSRKPNKEDIQQVINNYAA